MAFRRSKSSFRRSSGSRFAKKQRLWVTTDIAVTETAGAVTAISLLEPTQWMRNTTSGNYERAKVLFQLLILTAGYAATTDVPSGRVFQQCIDEDDTTDLLDPSTAAAYRNVQPYHIGTLYIRPDVVAGPLVVPAYNGNVDGVRARKVNRNITASQRSWLVISPPQAAEVCTYGGICRTLIEYQ